MMPDDLIELIAPGGCDEANHGTERYRVDNNGRVRVSREAADWLVRKGGFRHAPPPPPEPTSAITAPSTHGGGADMTDHSRKRSAR